MKSLSTDPITDGSPLTPIEKSFFDELAKEAADQSPDDNEGEMVSGTTPDPSPVEDRETGPDAMWGSEGPKEPDHNFSSVARKEFIQGRKDLLEKLFDNKPKNTENREVKPESLGERVRKLTGRD